MYVWLNVHWGLFKFCFSFSHWSVTLWTIWFQIKSNKREIDIIKVHGGAVPSNVTNKLNQLDSRVGHYGMFLPLLFDLLIIIYLIKAPLDLFILQIIILTYINLGLIYWNNFAFMNVLMTSNIFFYVFQVLALETKVNTLEMVIWWHWRPIHFKDIIGFHIINASFFCSRFCRRPLVTVILVKMEAHVLTYWTPITACVPATGLWVL